MSAADGLVLVVGGSGFVGSHVVKALVQRGRKVRAMLRKTSSTEALQGLPIEIVLGDVLDPSSLRAAMTGCTSIFYCVVDPRFWLTDESPIIRNNIDGLVNAMDAALDCDVEHFIFTSTIGTLGLNPDGPVTEDIPFNWPGRAPSYVRTRREAENQFLEYCRKRGLPGVALCIANTYGPEDFQPTPHNGGLWQIASGEIKVALDVRQPTVDIRDVAEAAVQAEIHGKVGERYIIANEFASNREFFAMAVAELGQAMPRLISYRLAYNLAWISERAMKLFGQRDFVFSTDTVYLSNVFREMDTSKAREELRWTPRPLAQTVSDTITWFAGRQLQPEIQDKTISSAPTRAKNDKRFQTKRKWQHDQRPTR